MPEVEGCAALTPLDGYADVFMHRLAAENGRDLERADHAEAGDVHGAHPGDVAAIVVDRASRGLEEFGQQIEAGRLAGTVGADEPDDAAWVHDEVEAVDGAHGSEGDRETLDAQLGWDRAPSSVIDGGPRRARGPGRRTR